MEDVFVDWQRRLGILRRAHREAARHYSKNDKILGAFVVVFSAIVGSTVFGTLGSTDKVGIQVLAGVLSLTAASLSALQTFFDFGERSEKHRLAGIGFSRLAKELQAFTDSNPSDDEKKEFSKTFREEWDSIESEAPVIKASIVRELEEVSNLIQKTPT